MTPKPLTDAQRRAAAQLGQGATQQAVADELGTSVKTVRRLLTKRPDFAALVEEARSETSAAPPDAAPDKPTPRSVLEEMLVAVQKNGEPAKALRIQAAVALAKLPDESLANDRIIERVYVTRDHPDHDQVVGILDATPADEFVAVIDSEDDFKVLADRDIPTPRRPAFECSARPGTAFPVKVLLGPCPARHRPIHPSSR